MNYPQKLTRYSAKVVEYMVNTMQTGEEPTYHKFGKPGGVIMPAIIEHKATIPKCAFGDGFLIISIAHYYEQMGDLMSDPYMEFMYKSEGMIYPFVVPISFQQDSIAMYQESITAPDWSAVNVSLRCNYKMQRDHAAFANMWLRNIHHQQFPSVKFPLSAEELEIKRTKLSFRKSSKSL